MRTLRLFLTFLFALALAPSARAAGEITWSVRLEPADVRAGEQAQVIAEAKLAPEWHVYSLTPAQGGGPKPTSVALGDGSALKPAGEPVEPASKTEFDKGFETNVNYFEGAVAFGLPVQVPPGLSGEQKATVKIGYMVCKHGTCLPPDRLELPLTFTVAPGEPRTDRTAAITSVPQQPAGYAAPDGSTPPPANAAGPQAADGGTASQIQDARNKGFLAFLGLALLMGFAALLTPCVFPMVPITVSFFSKQKEMGGSAIKGAAAYSLGIIFTFTGLGVLMAVLFGATSISRLAANPYLNIGLALLFIVLALNLFGLFEIQLPAWLVDKTQAGAQRGGFVGPLLMGLTFTLTSFTCTFGFVGGLLAATTQGDLLWPILGMLAFSTAFASPFFLLALFPSYLAKMPKSGSWLVIVKGFMGFLELAAALKFLSNTDLRWQLGFLTAPVFLAIWSTIFLVAAMYLLGWLHLPHQEGMKVGPFRVLFGVASGAFGIWCLAGINGASLGKLDAFVPPTPYPGREQAAHGGTVWLKSYDEALARARSENKPLFIDFTGITCTNCREMEKRVFTRPEIAEAFKNFVTVSLYTDYETPESDRYKKMQQDRYGTVELPLYVVLSPDESKIGQISYEPDPSRFLQFLNTSRQRFAEQAGGRQQVSAVP